VVLTGRHACGLLSHAMKTTDTRAARAAGKIIEKARRSRNLSARGLAREVDLDFGYLRRIEKGQRASTVTYARIARVLGIDLGEPLALNRQQSA